MSKLKFSVFIKINEKMRIYLRCFRKILLFFIGLFFYAVDFTLSENISKEALRESLINSLKNNDIIFNPNKFQAIKNQIKNLNLKLDDLNIPKEIIEKANRDFIVQISKGFKVNGEALADNWEIVAPLLALALKMSNQFGYNNQGFQNLQPNISQQNTNIKKESFTTECKFDFKKNTCVNDTIQLYLKHRGQLKLIPKNEVTNQNCYLYTIDKIINCGQIQSILKNSQTNTENSNKDCFYESLGEKARYTLFEKYFDNESIMVSYRDINKANIFRLFDRFYFFMKNQLESRKTSEKNSRQNNQGYNPDNYNYNDQNMKNNNTTNRYNTIPIRLITKTPSNNFNKNPSNDRGNNFNSFLDNLRTPSSSGQNSNSNSNRGSNNNYNNNDKPSNYNNGYSGDSFNSQIGTKIKQTFPIKIEALCNRCVYNCERPTFYNADDKKFYYVNDNKIIAALRNISSERDNYVGCSFNTNLWYSRNKPVVYETSGKTFMACEINNPLLNYQKGGKIEEIFEIDGKSFRQILFKNCYKVI